MALLPDNTPYAILLPATLNTFFQAAEDYYDRWEIMSFIRLIRFVAAFLTVTLPGCILRLRSIIRSFCQPRLPSRLRQREKPFRFLSLVRC